MNQKWSSHWDHNLERFTRHNIQHYEVNKIQCYTKDALIAQKKL